MSGVRMTRYLPAACLVTLALSVLFISWLSRSQTQDEISAIQSELDNSRHTIEEMRSSFDVTRARLASMERSVAKLEKQVEALTEEIKRLQSSLAQPAQDVPSNDDDPEVAVIEAIDLPPPENASETIDASSDQEP